MLVGGEGTRLRPLTLERPKPVLPLLGRPLLAYVLERLAEAGVTRVIFGCGYLPDPIQACFGDRALGLELEYVVEPRPMGTAGGIRHAARGRVSETFLALNGDILADAPLADLVAAHRACAAVATIALTPVEDPSRYGLVRTDENGRVLGFVEKPEPAQIDTDLINAGAYVLEAGVLDLIEDGRPSRSSARRSRRSSARASSRSRRAATGRTSARPRATSRRTTTCSAGAFIRDCPDCGRGSAGSTRARPSRRMPSSRPRATSRRAPSWPPARGRGRQLGRGGCAGRRARAVARRRGAGTGARGGGRRRGRRRDRAACPDRRRRPRRTGAVVGAGVSIPAGAEIAEGERVFPEGVR